MLHVRLYVYDRQVSKVSEARDLSDFCQHETESKDMLHHCEHKIERKECLATIKTKSG